MPFANNMRIDPAHLADFNALPVALRQLLEAELDAGNEIVEVGHWHPAPPIGAFFKLARPVTTRVRANGSGLSFYERNGSQHRGEFTDADRRYWVLEAAIPDDGYPDMDAIRRAHEPPPFRPDERAEADNDAFSRFRESMQLNYERWREGESYALDALPTMSSESRAMVEARLTPPQGWRDVEALAALFDLGSETARTALSKALDADRAEVRMAVLRFAPELVDDARRTRAIVQSLGDARIYEGLSETLDAALDFHPAAVMDALFTGLLTAPGEVAYHMAATIAVVYGAADSRYDWTLRPLFLQFNTDDVRARRAAFLKLCTTIGMDGPARLVDVDATLSTTLRGTES